MGQFLSKSVRRMGRRNRRKNDVASFESTPPRTDSSGNPIPEDSTLIDGRAFKKSGSPVYPLPNDDSEYGRLNSQHLLLRYLLQNNYLSPVTEDLKRGIKVLETGCGTGVWIMELAKEFPNSTFTGSDITNVFADFMANAPPNCTFLEADTAKGLPFDDNTFDFVFERANMTCFSNAVWPAVLRELIRVTKPGGYIELVEGCLPKNAGPALTQHVDWFLTLLRLRGVNDECMKNSSLLTAAGITDIKSSHWPWKLGWGPNKEFGERNAHNYIAVVKATRPQITAALGIGDGEYEEVIRRVEYELIYNDGEFEPVITIYNHYGRKPIEN